MTESNHIILGIILSQMFYYIFLRKYSLKIYRELKNLRNTHKKDDINFLNIKSFDEFIKDKKKNNI
jgi:hypothetical protein